MKQSVMLLDGAIRIRAETRPIACGGIMIHRFPAIALLAIGATATHAQPSLLSSFQAKTIHSPEGADIFVRSGGKGPVVVLILGYAEKRYPWAPLAGDLTKHH